MDPGKRTKESTGESIQQGNTTKIGGPFKVGDTKFIETRLEKFNAIYQQQQEQIKNAEKQEIKITLKDGKVLPGKAFETTPLQIALKIHKKLAENSVAAKIVYSSKVNLGFQGEIIDADAEAEGGHVHKETNFQIWDLSRPLEGDCTLELVSFDDPIGKEVFWHSSAHILGFALEQVYGAQLCIGPPLDNGFFYDSYMGEVKVSQADYAKIEKAAEKISAEKWPFQRAVLTKAQALDLFSFNPFKVQLITNKIPENGLTTAYKCGQLIDLCTGPHLPTTEKVKAFKITKNSAAYWLAKNTNDDLQRVYGITFPAKKQLDEYIKIQEELAKRAHQNVGKQQQLYLFHHLSPGAAFFYPNGARIYNKLMDFLRKQYFLRGYEEVISPNMYNIQLWKISGHYDKYQENMFLIKMGEEGDYGVKPMNCPGHCLMFDMIQHSYRDLPIRYADFGALHRNEVHGALSGLTRVRRFQQDDAHIFCRHDQIQDEIFGVLDFLAYIYKIFGFEYKLYLSTRPEKFLGTKDVWENAEKQLQASLERFGKPFEINHGDGAFYGPKIDVKLFDAYKREHQCGTIQLDFNLPERFNLQYRAGEQTEDVIQDKIKMVKEQSELVDQILEVQRKESSASMEKESPQQQLQQQQKQESSPIHPNDDKDTQQSQAASSSVIHSVLHEKKFDLGYHHLKAGFQRPVMIHRAIYGSFERLIAILTEQTGGKWPFWLSPKQVQICPISQKFANYGQAVALRLRLEGYQAGVDNSDSNLNKKVRNAQLGYWNFIGVVGEEEEKTGTIDIRDRDKNERIGKFTIEQLIVYFKSQEPEMAEMETQQLKQAFYRQQEKEFNDLNEELTQNMFLSGFQMGERDQQVFAKLQQVQVDPTLYPNILRWWKYMQHHTQKQ